MDTIKEFFLKRVEDETGISGTGVVARGVVLPSGAVVLEWQTFHSSICVYKNIGDVEAIHGHHGKTLVVMGPPPPDPSLIGHKRLRGISGITIACGENASVSYYGWKNVTCEECLKHKKK